MTQNSNPIIEQQEIVGQQFFVLVDTDERWFDNRRIRRVLDRYKGFFVDYERLALSPELTYVALQELIEKLSQTLRRVDGPKLLIGDEVRAFIKTNAYAIREQRTAGETIKARDVRWSGEIQGFNNVLAREITRPLKAEQIPGSFYLAKMKKAANFSVPGAGKTAMMYATFAYLSSPEINKVNKMVIISPINAFEAWCTEFDEVFGGKRKLKFMNLKDAQYKDVGRIRTDWGVKNVIVINYEALQGKLKVLNELIDAKTMIVFDEVHRVKGINGSRAAAALDLGKQAEYHYVLTGTPIPNGYKDIYNFLHLLYDNEYDSYFGWSKNDLNDPNSEVVNDKLYPFFWRMNKEDLHVPPADEDEIIAVEPSPEQQKLLEAIYGNETNILGLFLRLLQASTNPSLLLDNINYQDLGFVDEELNLNRFNAMNDEEQSLARMKAYADLNISSIGSAKFERGIDLIVDLVNQGKKVIVWGMFVKTMHKIQNRLRERSVSANLVYGGTNKDDRVGLINDFRDGDTEVMISNPNTLGESISLHKTVHDAVYFEYNFNLTFMLQSRDRIHRLGLKPGQHTHYYYLMTKGDRAHQGFIDLAVYDRLTEKEDLMRKAIDGDTLIPEVSDDYLEDVKRIIRG